MTADSETDIRPAEHNDLVVLDDKHFRLTTDLLERAANPIAVQVAPETLDGVKRCREFVTRHAEDHPVYGMTTGYGPLVAFPGRDTAADQCENLLMHLLAGQGSDLEPMLVRATMLVRLWSLCRGRSGAAATVVEALVAALSADFAPAVPRLGSLGASGDLIPLAHLTEGLRGRGHAYLAGRRLPAADALRCAGLRPLVLGGRDALALVNGTSLTAAAAGLAVAAAARALTTAARLSALLSDVLGAAAGYADSRLLDAYGHRGTIHIGHLLRGLLSGMTPSSARPLQEPYSIRCVPQLLGAAGAALAYVADVVDHDLNGVSDNPLFFPEDDTVAHGGNFFGQPVAFAADLLTLVVTQLATLAERQLDLLVDPHRNGGLPPMLAAEPGRQHGVQGVQLAATAIVAEMRRTATPASIQSLPTNLHNQDVVPFGTQAALNALDHVRLLRIVHGSLGVALRQTGHVGGRRPTSPSCATLFDELAAAIPPIDPDRPLDEDVRTAASLLDATATPSADW